VEIAINKIKDGSIAAEVEKENTDKLAALVEEYIYTTNNKEKSKLDDYEALLPILELVYGDRWFCRQIHGTGAGEYTLAVWKVTSGNNEKMDKQIKSLENFYFGNYTNYDVAIVKEKDIETFRKDISKFYDIWNTENEDNFRSYTFENSWTVEEIELYLKMEMAGTLPVVWLDIEKRISTPVYAVRA
jgi:hypothetical protein